MGTHSVPMIATVSRTATAPHVAGLLPDEAVLGHRSLSECDARSQKVMRAVA